MDPSCGATGTALDRVARVVAGGNSSSSSREASKHLSSWLGHAGQAVGPSLRPTTVPHALPALSSHTTTAAALPAMNHSVPQPQQIFNSGAQQQAAVAQMGNGLAQQQAMHMQQHHQQQQQQQQMLHMQQNQQQAMMMQMMQQQMAHMAMMRQQQQQQQNLDTKTTATTTESSASKLRNPLETWHEGLEQEITAGIQRQLEEEDVATVGHEGNVQGASMEELAAAWAEAQAEYDEYLDDGDAAANLWNPNNSSIQDGTLPTYEFTQVLADDPPPPQQQDWMERGMRELEAGNLSEAIHAFETELRHGNADNAQAWRLLGQCHAENDMDQHAIVCLEHAVDRDPYDAPALLALGVSYVNELQHEAALRNLKAWITHNPQLAGMEIHPSVYQQQSTGDASASRHADQESALQEVQRLLQQALEFDPSDIAVSSQIREALGVTYNVSRDYEAATAVLREAVADRPDDYQLWNKLGATRANGQQSEQALEAYHQALRIKPKYARAWLNMAIAHSNLAQYDDAARCYLQTLSLNPAATHCWSYLRIALSCAERWDLIPHAASQNLQAFAGEFDFVQYNNTPAATTS